MNMALVPGITVIAVIAGFITKKIGYYTPWMVIGAVLMSIGAGLITTFTVHTSHPKWIGYQVLFGLGMGIGMQQPNVAVQTVLQRRDVPTGASLVFFFQDLGGSLFTSVANNLFDNKLKEGLQNIPGIDAKIIKNVGATDLRRFVPPGHACLVPSWHTMLHWCKHFTSRWEPPQPSSLVLLRWNGRTSRLAMDGERLLRSVVQRQEKRRVIKLYSFVNCSERLRRGSLKRRLRRILLIPPASIHI